MAKKPVPKKVEVAVKPPSPSKGKKPAVAASDLQSVLGATGPSTIQLRDIADAVARAVELQGQIDNLEDAIKSYNKELRQLTENIIPDKMLSAGSTSFTASNGAKVTLKDLILGSLPKDDVGRSKAIEWMVQHDGSDLIKTKIEAVFGKGDHNFVKEVEAKLTKMKVDFNAKEDVHAGSLAAWVRERLKAGQETPLETLGLFSLRKAEIKMPKQKEPSL
jgi:hypothetical protein